MAAGTRSLTDALVDWISIRLALARTASFPAPRWPPTPEVRKALEDGQVAAALEVPDSPDARYLVVDHLRLDAPHLLLARDEDMDRDVVIKLLRGPTDLAREAAVREARLTAKLSHPNIVTIYEVDRDGAFLVLERLDGDLRDFARTDRELLLDALCQAGRALAAAHARNVWHLDFKPENVLIRELKDRVGRTTSQLLAKVTDFGVAQVVGPRRGLGGDLDGERTGQWAGGDLEDQRAFASAVWETLTGDRRPPEGSELLAPELHAVLSRALMAEPSQRWADMTALVDAIERARGGTAAARAQIEDAIALAEDGNFSSATQRWSEARRILTGRHADLGEGGIALGATLLQATAGQPSASGRWRGYQRALEVLEDALEALDAAGQRELAIDAAELAVIACDRLLELGHTRSSDPTRLELRAATLRARHQQLVMPATDNPTLEETPS